MDAAIDFFPSRGAKNRSADSWVALDPSYKQYEYLPWLSTDVRGEMKPCVIINPFNNPISR